MNAPTSKLGVHPGREWFTVLSGTVRLHLGERTILVETGDAAEFSTMVPHAIGAHDGPVDILTISTTTGSALTSVPRARICRCDGRLHGDPYRGRSGAEGKVRRQNE